MCESCAGRYRRVALKLIRELDSNRLEVVLIPSADPDIAGKGGKVRAVQSENPPWYQDFCGQFETRGKKRLRRRKFQTCIKRAHTLRALRELTEGRVSTTYAHRLIDFIRNRRHEAYRRAA